MARRNTGLVYGGGNVGLMGVLADAVLKAGGEAQGGIPEHLMAREIGHSGLTKLHVEDQNGERSQHGLLELKQNCGHNRRRAERKLHRVITILRKYN